jgi:hypothetical protein
LNPAHSTSRRRELFQQHRQRQLNVSSKRRQGGKVETHFDLVMVRDASGGRRLLSPSLVVNEVRSSRAPANRVENPWRSSQRGRGVNTSRAG